MKLEIVPVISMKSFPKFALSKIELDQSYNPRFFSVKFNLHHYLNFSFMLIIMVQISASSLNLQ